jgi:hypothetical protein
MVSAALLMVKYRRSVREVVIAEHRRRLSVR